MTVKRWTHPDACMTRSSGTRDPPLDADCGQQAGGIRRVRYLLGASPAHEAVRTRYVRCPARPAWFGNPVRLWCRAGPRSIGECGISVMYVGANWRYVAGRGDRIAAARQDTIVEGLPGDGEPLPLPIDKLEGVDRPRP